MKSRIFALILSVVLFSQISYAQLCAALKDVSCGETHILVLDDHNDLWAAGSGSDGQMGLGNIGSTPSLQRVKGLNGGFLKNIIEFDAGWEHSLAVDSNHFLLSWGNDSWGKLGNGPNESSSNVPIHVHAGQQNPSNPDAPLRHIVKVSAGRSGQHSLAVDSNGFCYAWGFNSQYGQCGDESYTDRELPVFVVDSCDQTVNRYLGNEAFIIDISAGRWHSIALERDHGFVYEWGINIGARPQKVHNESGTGVLRNITAISCLEESIALDCNNQVWQWSPGGNPTRVSGGQMGTTYLQNIVQIAAGESIFLYSGNGAVQFNCYPSGYSDGFYWGV